MSDEKTTASSSTPTITPLRPTGARPQPARRARPARANAGVADVLPELVASAPATQQRLNSRSGSASGASSSGSGSGGGINSLMSMLSNVFTTSAARTSLSAAVANREQRRESGVDRLSNCLFARLIALVYARRPRSSAEATAE